MTLKKDIRTLKGKEVNPKQEKLTIYDIKRKTAETSPYFFDAKTMKFFGQGMSDFSVYKRKDGKYDVVAPSYDIGWDKSKRFMGYTRRIFNPKTNELEMEQK